MFPIAVAKSGAPNWRTLQIKHMLKAVIKDRKKWKRKAHK
jgi:hypothetical protein